LEVIYFYWKKTKLRSAESLADRSESFKKMVINWLMAEKISYCLLTKSLWCA